MRAVSMFAGFGMFDLALDAALGARPVLQLDLIGERVRHARFPAAQQWVGDVRAMPLDAMPPHDVIAAGFPCQDLSAANRDGRGLHGERSALFWQVIRAIDAHAPGLVILENVPRLLTRWRAEVDHALLSRGYAVAWVKIAAAHVGAPHLRRRVFVVARRQAATGSTVTDAGTTPRAGAPIPRLPVPASAAGPLPLAGASCWVAPGGGRLRPTPAATAPNEGEPVASWLSRRDRVAAYSRPISPPLGIAVKLRRWPTPTRQDRAGSGVTTAAAKAKGFATLTDAVCGYRGEPLPDTAEARRWYIPSATDHKGSNSPEQRRRQLSSQVEPGAGGLRLNPDWVETLMGLPPGWTDPSRPVCHAFDWAGVWPALFGQDPHPWEPPRAVPHFRGRRERIAGIGNGIVWRQAAEAIRIGLRELDAI